MIISYEDLKTEDIPLLTPMMKAAFDEDTRMHTDLSEDGPWGYDTGELLAKLPKQRNADFMNSGSAPMKMVHNPLFL